MVWSSKPSAARFLNASSMLMPLRAAGSFNDESQECCGQAGPLSDNGWTQDGFASRNRDLVRGLVRASLPLCRNRRSGEMGEEHQEQSQGYRPNRRIAD